MPHRGCGDAHAPGGRVLLTPSRRPLTRSMTAAATAAAVSSTSLQKHRLVSPGTTPARAPSSGFAARSVASCVAAAVAGFQRVVGLVVLRHETATSRRVLVFLRAYENTADQAPFASLLVHLKELINVVHVIDGATRPRRKLLGLRWLAPVLLEELAPCAIIVCPRVVISVNLPNDKIFAPLLPLAWGRRSGRRRLRVRRPGVRRRERLRGRRALRMLRDRRRTGFLWQGGRPRSRRRRGWPWLLRRRRWPWLCRRRLCRRRPRAYVVGPQAGAMIGVWRRHAAVAPHPPPTLPPAGCNS